MLTALVLVLLSGGLTWAYRSGADPAGHGDSGLFFVFLIALILSLVLLALAITRRRWWP